jgi:hypothetical protein
MRAGKLSGRDQAPSSADAFYSGFRRLLILCADAMSIPYGLRILKVV